MSENMRDTDTSSQGQDETSTDGANNSDSVVHLPSYHDADGVDSAHAVLTPDSDCRAKEMHCDLRPAIPVIVIPGVMGSVLADKETGARIWSAPNMDELFSFIAGIGSVVGDWFQGAVTRATRFDPVQAVVDPRGPILSLNKERDGITTEEARRRGWATIHRWSYQPTLVWLQQMLNNPMRYGELQGDWVKGDPAGKTGALKAVLGTPPSDYGGHGSGEALTPDSEAFKTFASYRYPVYAIGYNFLQSNELSGRDVLQGSDVKLKGRNEHLSVLGIRAICRENKTDKAIIITHSMGGLVARMASALCGGADDMLAVVHSAQPATGAPLFAKRFRSVGEGFVNGSLLGRDAAEFVAIASNAEGPMELSPMPDYHDGQPWWIFVDAKGRERLSLPKASALEELYANDAWYGLLPDPKLLDPAGVVKTYLEKEGMPISVHEYFKRRMGKVVARQDSLRNQYHPNTYALFGSGALKAPEATPESDPRGDGAAKIEISKPENDLLTLGRVIWQGDIPEGVGEAELMAATWVRDSGKGEIVLTVGGQTVRLTVQNTPEPFNADKDTRKDNGVIPGDGTVPVWSSEAQGRGVIRNVSTAVGAAEGVQMAFVQGGYEHQFSFEHPWSRWAMLYSVVQAVHRAKGGSA